MSTTTRGRPTPARRRRPALRPRQALARRRRLAALGVAQLTRMRTALLLLLLLASWPSRDRSAAARHRRRARSPSISQDPGNGGARPARGFDVYSSPWFAAVYLLLFASLVGCVVPRRPPTDGDAAAPPAHAPAAGAAPGPPLWSSTAAGEGSTGRRRAAPSPLPGGPARRHQRLRRARATSPRPATCVFHLALLLLLAAVAVGSLLGYSGPGCWWWEGTSFSKRACPTTTASPPVRGSTRGNLSPFKPHARPHARALRGQGPTGSQFGAPREFRRRPHRPRRARRGSARRSTIHPRTSRSTRAASAVFIIGNGYAPVITVRDGNGQGRLQRPSAVPAGRLTTTSRSASVKVPTRSRARSASSGFLLPTYVDRPAAGSSSRCSPTLHAPGLAMSAYVSKPGQDALTTAARRSSVYSLDCEPAAVSPGARRLARCGSSSSRVCHGRAARRRGARSPSTGLRRYVGAGRSARPPSKLWVLGVRARGLARRHGLAVRAPPARLGARAAGRRPGHGWP